MNFVSFVARWVVPTERIYGVSNSTRVLSYNVQNISIENLPLLDLQGKPVDLTKQVDKYLLLIFLRHLA